MANLVCWASGLLEVLADKDTPLESGPVVLMHGMASKMRSAMTAHGEPRMREGGKVVWHVPGTRPIPLDGAEAALVQRDNMTLVIAFNKRLHGVDDVN